MNRLEMDDLLTNIQAIEEKAQQSQTNIRNLDQQDSQKQSLIRQKKENLKKLAEKQNSILKSLKL